MTLEIRKMCKFVDTTYIEDFKKCDEPVELISVAAVITNPWVDQGYVDDLKPITITFCIFNICKSPSICFEKSSNSILSDVQVDKP